LAPDKECSRGDIHFVRSPFTKIPFLAKNFPVDLAAFLRVSLILKKINPDIVHIQAKFLFFPAAASSILLKIPYVFTVLDYYNLCPRNILLRKNGQLCEDYHGARCYDCVSQTSRVVVKRINYFTPDFLKKLIFIFRKKSVDYFMKKVSRVITFSDTSKDRLVAYGYKKDKVAVVYHYSFDGVRPDPNPAESIKSKKILFVGTITYHKGLHVIIEAMQGVVKEVPEAKLLVAGSGKGSYFESIQDSIKRNNLSGNIEFLGHKSNEEILGLMKDAAVVVVPEQWYSEFGPVILIEAKLSHKPVVASRIGSIPEFINIGAKGFLVGYDNSQGFAKEIINLIRKPNVGSEGNNETSGTKKMEMFDKEKAFSALENIYAG
jgi:glycosyltransferase involved in cell wall biosynthesis